MTQKFDSLFSKYIDFQPQRGSALPENGIYRDSAGNFCVAVNGVKVATLDGGGGGGGVTTAVNVAALMALTASQPDVVILEGWHTSNDGGGGTFLWDSASTTAVDGGTIFQVTGVPVGRYKRLFSGALNSKWFGTTGAGTSDDTIALQNAILAAANWTLEIPKGTYKVSLLGQPLGGGAVGQNALSIRSPTTIVLDPEAKILMAPLVSLPVGWGTGAGNVIGVVTVQSNDVTIQGGIFDFNIANSTVVGIAGYVGMIYVTTDNPGSGGPYHTNVHITECKIRNARGAGIWTEDTSKLWITYTDHAGGTGTDILVLRSLINLTDVHVDNNYIDSSTLPPVGGATIQLSINFTGSAGLFTDRWSMNYNTCEAGLNTNVYYTMTQIYSASSPTEDGVWRRGEAIGNILSGAIGGGGPLGGAEAISAVNVSDSVIANNVVKNCYIGIELAGFNCTLADNTIDGGEQYMQLGLLMDGVNSGHTVTGNTIRGFGVWDNYQGIAARATKCAFVGNKIECRFGLGVNGTGIIIYVDGENSATGDDTNTIIGNVLSLGGASLAVDVYDTSNLVVANNTIVIETPTNSPIRMQAPGTVGHATRDFISIHNNVVIGGALPIVNQVASADWGTNISLQTDRIDKVMSGSISFTALAVNFNSVADTQIPIILPNDYTRYKVNEIRLSGASHSLTTAQVGLFTAAAAGGAAIVAGGTAVL